MINIKRISNKYFIDKIKKMSVTKTIYKWLFQFVGMFPARSKLIVFESYLGKQYSCNPRAIYEYLRDNYPEFKMYWSIDPRYSNNFDENLKVVPRFSIKWLFIMASAKYWVTNSRMPLWIPKPKHTIYLQTWHGTPLKKLAADIDEIYMPGTNTERYKENFYKESRNWDYLISPNPYSTEIFRRAFQYQREIIESGYPRNDFLFNANNKDTIHQLKKQYGLPLDKKVILYAPTWRDDQYFSKGKYKFDIKMDLDLLQKNLSDRYCLILRLHYLIADHLNLKGYEGFVYDFSNHKDIRELYVISDLLITDYSSVIFDYANLKRPIIFYTYDLEDYRDRLRGFYFDLEEHAPGPLVKNTEDLVKEIEKIEKNGFVLSENFQQFQKKFCIWEKGNASKIVVEKVFKKNN